MNRYLSVIAFGLVSALAGCTAFPTAGPGVVVNDGLSADDLLARTLSAHGGDIAEYPGDINISTDGRWYTLIKRIQPVVSDAGFRITSQERYRPSTGVYAIHHQGPDGSKQVLRTPDGLIIHYNGTRDTDPATHRATAMTNDAFRLFHFGPSFIKARATALTRLSDTREGGTRYHRVLATLRPGFGESVEDQVVMWINADTGLMFRVHMTLEGFETTRGAHVDTTFLEYLQAGPYVLPARFFERVRGPLRINAHEWHVTGIDLDRGWTANEVSGAAFTGAALAPAAPIVDGNK